MNTFTVRHLLSLAIFAAVGAGLYFGNANFAPEISQVSNIGIAIISGLVCSVAFAYFTRPNRNSDSSVSQGRSTGSGGRNSAAPAKARTGGRPLPQRTDVMVQLATGRDVTAAPERREQKPRTVDNATFSIGEAEGKKVVTVKVTGLTGAQFKKDGGSRARITSVAGVKWQHPKNDAANKVNTITGIVNDNAEGSVRAALEKLGVTASA
jgi:hypothetical protein